MAWAILWEEDDQAGELKRVLERESHKKRGKVKLGSQIISSLKPDRCFH